jgi:hypothetical protein
MGEAGRRALQAAEKLNWLMAITAICLGFAYQ